MIHSSAAISPTRKRSASREPAQNSGVDGAQSSRRRNSPHPANLINADIARNIIGAHALTQEPLSCGRDLEQLLAMSDVSSARNLPIGPFICSRRYPALAAAYKNAAELVIELEEMAACVSWLNAKHDDEFEYVPSTPEGIEVAMREPEGSIGEPGQEHPDHGKTLPDDFVSATYDRLDEKLSGHAQTILSKLAAWSGAGMNLLHLAQVCALTIKTSCDSKALTTALVQYANVLDRSTDSPELKIRATLELCELAAREARRWPEHSKTLALLATIASHLSEHPEVQLRITELSIDLARQKTEVRDFFELNGPIAGMNAGALENRLPEDQAHLPLQHEPQALSPTPFENAASTFDALLSLSIHMSAEPARSKALEALLGSLALVAPRNFNGDRDGSVGIDLESASNCLFAFQPHAKLLQIYGDMHREAMAYANLGTEQGRDACTRLMAGLTRLGVRLPLDSMQSIWSGRPERSSGDAPSVSWPRTWALVLDREEGVGKLTLAWDRMRQLVNDSPRHLADFMLSFADEPLPVLYCFQGTFCHEAMALFASSPSEGGRFFSALAAMLAPDKLRGYLHDQDLAHIAHAIKNVIEHQCRSNPVEFLPALLQMNKHYAAFARFSNYSDFCRVHQNGKFDADTWKKLHAIVLDTHADSLRLTVEATDLITFLLNTGDAYDALVLPSLVRALRVLDAASAGTLLEHALQRAAHEMVGQLVNGDRSGNSEFRTLCLRKMGSVESSILLFEWFKADGFDRLSPLQRSTLNAELWEALPSVKFDEAGVDLVPALMHLLESIEVETATLDGFRLGPALRHRASNLAALIETNTGSSEPDDSSGASSDFSVMSLLIGAAVQLVTLSEAKRDELNTILMDLQDPYGRSAPHDVLRQIHAGDHLELCHSLALGTSIASADREFKLRGRLIQTLLHEKLSPQVASSIQRTIDGIGSSGAQDASVHIVDSLASWLCASAESEHSLAAGVVEALLGELAGSADHLPARLKMMDRFFATSPGICYEHMETALRGGLDQLVAMQTEGNDSATAQASQSFELQLLAFHGFLEAHPPERASAAAAPLFATLVEIASCTSNLPSEVLDSMIDLLEVHCLTSLPAVAVACRQWPGQMTESLNARALVMTADAGNASPAVISSKQILDMVAMINFA